MRRKRARPGWVSEAPSPALRPRGMREQGAQAAALSGHWRSNGSTTQPLQALFPLQPQGWAGEDPGALSESRGFPSQVRSVWGLPRGGVLFFSKPADRPKTAWTGLCHLSWMAWMPRSCTQSGVGRVISGKTCK